MPQALGVFQKCAQAELLRERRPAHSFPNGASRRLAPARPPHRSLREGGHQLVEHEVPATSLV